VSKDFIVSKDTRFLRNLRLGMCFESCHILLWFPSLHCECFSTFLVMRTPHKVSLTPWWPVLSCLKLWTLETLLAIIWYTQVHRNCTNVWYFDGEKIFNSRPIIIAVMTINYLLVSVIHLGIWRLCYNLWVKDLSMTKRGRESILMHSFSTNPCHPYSSS